MLSVNCHVPKCVRSLKVKKHRLSVPLTLCGGIIICIIEYIEIFLLTIFYPSLGQIRLTNSASSLEVPSARSHRGAKPSADDVLTSSPSTARGEKREKKEKKDKHSAAGTSSSVSVTPVDASPAVAPHHVPETPPATPAEVHADSAAAATAAVTPVDTAAKSGSRAPPPSQPLPAVPHVAVSVQSSIHSHQQHHHNNPRTKR